MDDPIEQIIGNSGRYSYFYLDELARLRDAVAVLVRLFMFAGEVAVAELDVVAGPLLDILWGHELILADPARPAMVYGAISIVEHRGRYFLSDPLFENRSSGFIVYDDSALCMPLHSSSLELLDALRAPDHAASFLDVGSGSGCQSLLFGGGYGRVVGFDPNPRAVRFAQLNSAMNGVDARFDVDAWETFRDGPFDHIAFNAPDMDTAFSYLNDGLDGMLSESGHAQVRIVSEILEEEGTWPEVLVSRIPELEKWELSTLLHEDSPFALSAESVRSGRIPYGKMVIDHPSKTDRFWADVTERGVVEIVVATLTIRRRP